VTVIVAVPLLPPDVAPIVAVPGETAVEEPLLPAALLTVATDGSEEDQVAEAVRSCVLASL